MSRQRSSSGDGEQPYRKVQFWLNPTNQFWNDPKKRFSQRVKDYYDNWLQRMVKNERRCYRLNETSL
jgi:hypothetical protein